MAVQGENSSTEQILEIYGVIRNPTTPSPFMRKAEYDQDGDGIIDTAKIALSVEAGYITGLEELVSSIAAGVLNNSQNGLGSKVDKETGKALVLLSLIQKLTDLPTETDLTNSFSGKVSLTDVYNALDQAAAGKVLDARQGKALKDLIDTLSNAYTNHAANTSNPHSVTAAQVGAVPTAQRNQVVSFNNAIPFMSLFSDLGKICFSQNRLTTAGSITYTANTALTVNATGAIPGAVSMVRVLADGTNLPVLSAWKTASGSSGYVNTSGIWNNIVLFFDGADYWVNIFQETGQTAIDIVAPVLQSAAVADANKNRIVLTYNENISSSVGLAASDFTVSGGKTVSSIAISGTVIALTVNSNYSYGDTITVSGGAGKIQDAAGNITANLSSRAVTNNIAAPDVTAPVLSSAVVSDANKNKIVLTYNEALDASSVPATSDFAVSGGKTVSSIAISGTTITLTVNSDYTLSDTITVFYTPGSNKLRDAAGNNCAALTSQAVTNEIGIVQLIFGNLTGSVTQTGTTLSATSGGFGANLGRTAVRLAGNGYVQAEYAGSQDVDFVLGFYDQNANIAYTGMKYFIWVSVGTGTYYTGHAGGNLSNTGVAPQPGDKYRIRRTGSTFAAEYYRSGVWTALSWSGTPATSSADMYIVISASAPARLSNPVGLGLI